MVDPETFDEADPWQRADRSIVEAEKQLAQALGEEQFQAIGVLCREAMISLAQAVYDPAVHKLPDGVLPSRTDAKRMLEAYFVSESAGPSNEAKRRHIKTAIDLANDLQHKRTATYRDGAGCVEATKAVANMIAVVAGRTTVGATFDIAAEFECQIIRSSAKEHMYQLEVTVTNRSKQKIADFKLEFQFPDLDSILRRRLSMIPSVPEPTGSLVEIKPQDERVSFARQGDRVRVTYRSRDVLFPQEKLSLGTTIGLRYRVNTEVHLMIRDLPPLRWTLYADDMMSKEGEISLAQLNNYCY